MIVFPAMLEGREWLAGHPEVLKGTLAYAAMLRLEPWMDQRASGVVAADHWGRLPAGAFRAAKISWPGARGMDIGRELDGGRKVGCTVDEWVKGMIRGRFEVGDEPDRLNDCLEPGRAALLAGPRGLILNSEPTSEMHAYQRPEWLTRWEGETDAAFGYRKARAQDLCDAYDAIYANKVYLARLAKLHPDAPKCGPSTWGDIRCLNIARVTTGRLFHQAKVKTLRELLRLGGLLVPDTYVSVSFCRFGDFGVHAAGINDEPIPSLTAPRDRGVVWPGNWQWYAQAYRAMTQAALFRLASRGQVWPTLTPMSAEFGLLDEGCRGGVIFWIDEDGRARDEGRADKHGISQLSEDGRRSSEDWMTNEAARMTIEHRKAA